MNKSFLTFLIILTLILIPVGMYISFSNQEIRLRNTINAQSKKNEAFFDNTWKIIQQQAQVADQYKDSFKSIYSEIMSNRYGDKEKRGQVLMSWIQEQNPQFDIRLFEKLMTSIEAQRTGFTREQTKLLDLNREHKDLLSTIPSSFFVGSRKPIEIVIVTSGKTSESFMTGQDNDVNLFKK